jgi:hypothetical protein
MKGPLARRGGIFRVYNEKDKPIPAIRFPNDVDYRLRSITYCLIQHLFKLVASVGELAVNRKLIELSSTDRRVWRTRIAARCLFGR